MHSDGEGGERWRGGRRFEPKGLFSGITSGRKGLFSVPLAAMDYPPLRLGTNKRPITRLLAKSELQERYIAVSAP